MCYESSLVEKATRKHFVHLKPIRFLTYKVLNEQILKPESGVCVYFKVFLMPDMVDITIKCADKPWYKGYPS